MYRITVDASDVIEEEILEPLTGNVPDICKADIYHMKKEYLKDLCRRNRLLVSGNKPDLISRLAEKSKKIRLERSLGGITIKKLVKVYGVPHVCACLVATCEHVAKTKIFPLPPDF